MTAVRHVLSGLLLIAACGDQSAVVVEIRARATVYPTAEISVRVSDGTGDHETETYSLLGLELPKTLTVDTTGRSGTLTVEVDARDADGLHLGRASGAVEIPRDGRADLAVLLDPSEFTVNSTFAGPQDLTFVAPGFAGRQLASASDGSFLAVWGSWDLAMGRLYGADSRPRLNQSTLNDDEFILPLSPVVADTQFSPAVAHGPDGYLVVWAEFSPDGMAIYAQGMTDDDATRLGEIEAYVTSGSAGECFPSPIALAGGGYMLLWVRGSDTCEAGELRGVSLDENGAPDSMEFEIAAAGSATDAYPHGAPLPSGGFVAVWHREQGSDTDVIARIFDASGTPVGGEVGIAVDAAQSDLLPYVVATGDSDEIAVAWLRVGAEYESIMLQRFAGDGTSSSKPAEVARVSGYHDARPVMAVRASDNAIGVAWAEGDYLESSLDVWFRLLGTNGAPLSDTMRVPNVIEGNQATPSIAAAADGAFVVAWSDDSALGPDKDETAVKARVIYP